jgi:hypothetical protein
MHEAMQRWVAKGDRAVTLASGMRVKLRVRSAVELLREGNLPNELRSRALQYETGGWDPKTLSAEERLQAYDFMRTFIARTIVALEGEDGSWAEVHLGREDLVETPEDDVQQLQDIVTLRKSPIQVTAESEAKLGKISEAEARAVVEQEAGRTTNGWRDFRDGSGDRPAGGDGAAVREVAGAGLSGD